ncbi:SRPBCC family protein [Natronomonas salina]|uniref:SRPBCC family protein n=1 Tax=Natronomonas salina TaxID=1710540 RepID=UPI0015B425A4|nr:SRPBCC family protein [Natronomonas salina]QLD88137.1 SRPBCC family protein [Natronomonas salina]
MATYHRRTRVAAPFADVWRFHATADGLEQLTPAFLNLEIERVTGPDGEVDPEVLDAGSIVEASIRPFGVGPRQDWTSHILERTEDDGAAMFRDEMREGPFPHWEHTHRFFADGDGTVVEDRVAYELPCGPLGRAASPVGVVGLEPMFRHRHRRTKELLE